MTLPKKFPRNAVVIGAYEQLERHVRAFAERHFNLMCIVGPPGVGKSRIVQRTVGENCVRITGRLTPLMLFVETYKNLCRDLLFDDIDSLLADPLAIGQLKELCQSEDVKKLSWQSSSQILEGLGIPAKFETSSKVLLILNDWEGFSRKLKALEDRGHIIFFHPTAEEVHRYVGGWFQDQEVYGFIEKHLVFINEPSARMYDLSTRRKKAGLDWKGMLEEDWFDKRQALIFRIQGDPTLTTEAERAKAFEENGGGSRATYFRHKKQNNRTVAPESQSLSG